MGRLHGTCRTFLTVAVTQETVLVLQVFLLLGTAQAFPLVEASSTNLRSSFNQWTTEQIKSQYFLSLSKSEVTEKIEEDISHENLHGVSQLLQKNTKGFRNQHLQNKPESVPDSNFVTMKNPTNQTRKRKVNGTSKNLFLKKNFIDKSSQDRQNSAVHSRLPKSVNLKYLALQEGQSSSSNWRLKQRIIRGLAFTGSGKMTLVKDILEDVTGEVFEYPIHLHRAVRDVMSREKHTTSVAMDLKLNTTTDPSIMLETTTAVGHGPSADGGGLVITTQGNGITTSNNDYDYFTTSGPTAAEGEYYTTPYYPTTTSAYSPYVLKVIGFTRTLYFCEYIYSAMYGYYYSSFTETMITYDNKSLALISQKNFSRICLAFYREFNSDESIEENLMTLYPEDGLAFLHANNNCTQRSDKDLYFGLLLALALLDNNNMCFQAVCNNSIRVVDWVDEEVFIRFIHTDVILNDITPCFYYLEKYYHQGPNESETSWIRNRHWPTCFPRFDVVWMNDPETGSRSPAWNHLPFYCRASEGALTALAMCIVVIGFVGNLMVVVVLLRNRRSDPSNLLRLSLAAADLLVCVFVLLPGLDGRMSLVYSSTLDGDFHGLGSGKYEYSDMGIILVDGGFRLFSAILMSACCVVSLMNLFALSLERFLITCCNTHYKSLFTKFRTVCFIVISWTSGMLISLILKFNSDGSLSSLWSYYNKLPLGVSQIGLNYILPVVMAIVGLVCLSTIVLSLLAIFGFLHLEAKKEAERRQYRQTSVKPGQDNQWKVITSMSVMTILYTLSVAPGGGACVLHLLDILFPWIQLTLYLCWWVYFAATAWNPWLYNILSQQFRSDVVNTLKLLVPKMILNHPFVQERLAARRQEQEARASAAQENIELASRRTRRRQGPVPGVRRT